MNDKVLELQNLTAAVITARGKAAIVNGVDLAVRRGEVLAIVGESGSGKSMSMLCATGLVPPGVRVGGAIRLLDHDLSALPDKHVRKLRARHVGFVFQDPMSSLNPLMPVGIQIGEAYRMVYRKSRAEARSRAVDLLAQVGIPEADERINDYPHQFSGGMRQRVMIAMALACEPELLIADEATTALDVTTQAQVLALVMELHIKLNTAVIWITHDLGVVAGIADTVAVMYGGRIVEQAPVEALFESPAHPYTKALIGARPRLGGPRSPLSAIPGSPPSPSALPRGCAFYPRCPIRSDPRCRDEMPALVERTPGHLARTFCSSTPTVPEVSGPNHAGEL